MIAASEEDPERQFKLDREWHELLLAGCPNKRLVEMIQDLTTLVRRFDKAYTRGVADLSVSCRQHSEILRALEIGDYSAACNRLESHWMSCVEPVEKWLCKQTGDAAVRGGSSRIMQ